MSTREYYRAYYHNNKDKIAKRRKGYYELDPEKFKRQRMESMARHPLTLRKRTLKKYDLTLEGYDELFRDQKSKCAICKTSKRNRHGTFNVDHNHVTGKVRGLLCDLCNRGLGSFKDNIQALEEAIIYLRNGI